MLTTRRAPVRIWEDFLRTIGIDPSGTVLVVGPSRRAAVQLPAVPVLPGGHGMALLGPRAGLRIPDGADATDTGLPDACVDATVLLSAWTDPARMEDAAREAVRVTRRRGEVAMGDVAADVLTASMPSAYRAALLFELFPRIAPTVRDAHQHEEMLGVELLRAGVHPVDYDLVDVPMGVFDDADAYVAAIRSGMWPGVTLLDDEALDLLAEEVRRSLRGVRFPVVDILPWGIARGPRAS